MAGCLLLWGAEGLTMGMECLKLLKLPNLLCLVCWAAFVHLFILLNPCPFSSLLTVGKSFKEPDFHLSQGSRLWEPVGSLSLWLWLKAPLISRAPCNVGLCSQGRFLGLGIRSPALPLSPRFNYLPPTSEVWWGKCLVHDRVWLFLYPFLWDVHFSQMLTGWCTTTSGHSFRDSCNCYIFKIYEILEGDFHHTSHAVIFFPLLYCFPILFSLTLRELFYPCGSIQASELSTSSAFCLWGVTDIEHCISFRCAAQWLHVLQKDHHTEASYQLSTYIHGKESFSLLMKTFKIYS